MPIVSSSEQRLLKEHEAAVTHLEKWQADFANTLAALLKQVKDFSQKAQMSDAESYVQELADVQKKLDEFALEVCDW